MIVEPALRFVHSRHGDREDRLAYWDWNGPRADAPVCVCVHGLTRQGRDFDHLARALSTTHRVICPDVVGRGESDWLADPSGYQVPTYVGDILVLLANLGLSSVDWVGTSMGGLIGMVLASMPNTPVRRLLLNDVGPTVEAGAIARIGEYVGARMEFPDEEEAARQLWMVSQGFGPHSPQQWLAFTRPQLRQNPDGSVRLHYDPAIGVPLRAITEESSRAAEGVLWQCWDAIQAPTLVIRGAESDLLSAETVRRMSERGPRARVVELDGIGHAPTLIAHDQVELVCHFIRATQAEEAGGTVQP